VEPGWFRRRIAGEEPGFLYSSGADPDGELDHVDAAHAEQDVATYLREIDLVRQAGADRELDETFSLRIRARLRKAVSRKTTVRLTRGFPRRSGRGRHPVPQG